MSVAEEAVSQDRWSEPPKGVEIRRRLLTVVLKRAAATAATLYFVGFTKALTLSAATGIPLDAFLGSFDQTVAAGALGTISICLNLQRALAPLPWWPVVLVVAAIGYTALKFLFRNQEREHLRTDWSEEARAFWNRMNYRSLHWLDIFTVFVSVTLFSTIPMGIGFAAAGLRLGAVDDRVASGCEAGECDTYHLSSGENATGVQIAADAENIYLVGADSIAVVKRAEIVTIKTRESEMPELFGGDAIVDLGITPNNGPRTRF
jgi:hypothetical protein